MCLRWFENGLGSQFYPIENEQADTHANVYIFNMRAVMGKYICYIGIYIYLIVNNFKEIEKFLFVVL